MYPLTGKNSGYKNLFIKYWIKNHTLTSPRKVTNFLTYLSIRMRNGDNNLLIFAPNHPLVSYQFKNIQSLKLAHKIQVRLCP